MKRASANKRPPLKSIFKVQRAQLIMVTVLLVAIVLLTGYVWYSMQQWNNVSAHTDKTNTEVKTRILALQGKEHSLEEVKAETKMITKKIDEMCNVSPGVSWQRQIAPKIRDTLESCTTYRKSLSKARDALTTLSVRASSEQRFAAMLKAYQVKVAEIPPEKVESSREAWKDFAEKVKKIEVHESLEDAKESASITARELAQSYDELIKANKEENRTAYDEAAVSIQKGYSKLGEIQNLSVESYSRLVDEVRKTSQAL